VIRFVAIISNIYQNATKILDKLKNKLVGKNHECIIKRDAGQASNAASGQAKFCGKGKRFEWPTDSGLDRHDLCLKKFKVLNNFY